MKDEEEYWLYADESRMICSRNMEFATEYGDIEQLLQLSYDKEYFMILATTLAILAEV